MYKIFIDDHLYKKWHISPEMDLNLNLDLSPSFKKMFDKDRFIYNRNNNSIEIIESPIRNNKYIPGILDLSKTYGKDNKMLYLCNPNDKHLPYFLIPYSINPSFDKTKKHLYITFEFKNWNNVHPYGSITQNIGCINIPENFYEYMIYCKSLNVSIQPFTKRVIKELNKHKTHTLCNIVTNKFNIEKRLDKVFTIDSLNSIDLDDGISIKDNVLSIYITHVPIIIDSLNLWDAFTERVSTIYLPDKKRSMIPLLLSQLCSLNEKEERICLIMDINIKEGKFMDNVLSIGKVKIHKNYEYEEEKLLLNKDYNRIKEICCLNDSSINDSYEVIEYLMVYFNKECAKIMNNGIYKSYIEKGQHPIEKYTYKTTKYTYEKTDYAQFTSPIRRIVDLLNIINVTNISIKLSNEADSFYNEWYSNIDYINECMINIRKAQNKCKLLETFNKYSHQVFKGIVIEQNDNKYNVYLPDLKINTTFTTDLYIGLLKEYLFKIYVFNNEGELKKKIKLQLV
uniref:RNB domain-containing protein n=1 Tax=viral metagenome TaxID=1070528 RepID=A0A6C0ETL0_9ZZZZ